MSQPIPTTKIGAEIAKIMADIRMKILVTRCVLIGFFIVLASIFALVYFRVDWQITLILGIIDSILAGTMYPLVTHYHPAVKAAKQAEERDSN